MKKALGLGFLIGLVIIGFVESQPIFVPPGAGGASGSVGSSITVVGGTNISVLNLQGWSITTPHSQWDNTADGPAHTIVISSLGNQNVTDEGTGDGYIQFSSNLNGSNTTWLNANNGVLSVGNTTNWNAKMDVFKPVMNNLVTPSVTIGANSNLVTSIVLNRSGVVQSWSNSVNGFVSSITNNALFPPYHMSTNGSASSSTDIYTIFGAVNQLGLTTSGVLTNGNITCVPFYSGAGGVLDSLIINVNGGNAAGAFIMVGIATTQSSTNLLPGNVIFQTGAFDASVGGKQRTNLVTPIHLNPGQVYYTLTAANSNLTVGAIPLGACGTILGWNTNFAVQSFFLAQSVTNWNLTSNLPPTIPTTNYQLQVGPMPAVAGRFRDL